MVFASDAVKVIQNQTSSCEEVSPVSSPSIQFQTSTVRDFRDSSHVSAPRSFDSDCS